MCDEISVTITTQGDLRQLARIPLIMHGARPFQPNACLCNVNIEATLTRAGYIFKKTPFGYEAERKVEP